MGAPLAPILFSLLALALPARPGPLAVPPQRLWPRYLVVFRAKFGPCRLEELRCALSAVVGAEVPLRALDPVPAYGDPSRLVETCADLGPPVFHTVRFPSAALARAAARRCACVRAVLEVWAEGADDARCAAAAAALPPDAVAALHAPMADGRGWAVHFHAHGIGQKGGSGLTLAQRTARLQAFRPLLEPIRGPVVLSPASPLRGHTLWLVEDYDPPLASGGGAFKARGPAYVALGRLVSEGASAEVYGSRLAARAALHITSLPADLSVLLANCAQVRPGHTVLDPFAGAGSTLIGAALVARIHAAEIARVAGAGAALPAAEVGPAAPLGPAGAPPSGIRALGLDIEAGSAQSVAANFARLGLLGGEAGCELRGLQADIGALRPGEPPLSELPPVDAIVCDPPYGIMILQRGALALGAARADADGRAGELASLAPLFALAGAVLAPAGRLCFLLPAPAAVERVEALLPASASLELDGAIRMPFTAKQSRWLVRMRRRGAS